MWCFFIFFISVLVNDVVLPGWSLLLTFGSFQKKKKQTLNIRHMSQCPSVPVKLGHPPTTLKDSLCGRIYCEDKHSFLQDCEDDGETAAGGRLLHLLQVIIHLIKVSPQVVMWPVLNPTSIPSDTKALFPLISSPFSRQVMLFCVKRYSCSPTGALGIVGFWCWWPQFHLKSFFQTPK